MSRSFWLVFAVVCTLWCAGCSKRSEEPLANGGVPPPAKGVTDILFTYGSEKQTWVEQVTADFNKRGIKLGSGNSIRVTTQAKGSGDCLDELIAGINKAHITSPASSAFIKLGNAQWRAKTGKDLVPSTENLVLSPVVIAMWQPMAEALGWGKQPVGWQEILAMATEPQGWAARGMPQWGQFRFAHTHPQFSNSGLISLFAEVYAATGRKSALTFADVQKPEVAQFLGGIERSVVHYGSSTGFFAKKMFTNGPGYVSAAVLYENTVIESYQQQPPTSFPVVAIYPKEGTFWSDHPAGIVDREWVTPEHREASRQYLDFLLAREQQEKAMALGFRPSLAELALTAPLDAAHGVNPKEPQTTLEVPSVETMDAITRLWQQQKKRSNVTLVMDVSGSMNENGRMTSARAGAQEFVKMLGDEDTFRLVPFNSAVMPAAPAAPLVKIRAQSMAAVGSLIPGGGTALYDAINAAFDEQLENRAANKDKISAIVVLTDGADTDSRTQLQALLNHIRYDGEKQTIRIFTIGYDSGAQQDVLKKIADSTQAKFYEGKPQNIREVFRDISTFF